MFPRQACAAGHVHVHYNGVASEAFLEEGASKLTYASQPRADHVFCYLKKKVIRTECFREWNNWADAKVSGGVGRSVAEHGGCYS